MFRSSLELQIYIYIYDLYLAMYSVSKAGAEACEILNKLLARDDGDILCLSMVGADKMMLVRSGECDPGISIYLASDFSGWIAPRQEGQQLLFTCFQKTREQPFLLILKICHVEGCSTIRSWGYPKCKPKGACICPACNVP